MHLIRTSGYGRGDKIFPGDLGILLKCDGFEKKAVKSGWVIIDSSANVEIHDQEAVLADFTSSFTSAEIRVIESELEPKKDSATRRDLLLAAGLNVGSQP